MTSEFPTTCDGGVVCKDWLDAIVCGDCLNEMPKMPAQSVDAIISDLPYGTTACKWDSVIPFASLWAEWKRLLKPNGAIVLTATQPFATDLINSQRKMFRYEWIWEKSMPSGICNAKIMPMRYHENILVFGVGRLTYNPQMAERSEAGKVRAKSPIQSKSRSNQILGLNPQEKKQYDPDKVNPKSVLRFGSCPNSGGTKTHPTQKPESLMRYLVLTYTNPGDVVLDPCCGSGTTCVAAKQEGRHYIGIEKEQKYADSAKQRTRETLGMASNHQ